MDKIAPPETKEEEVDPPHDYDMARYRNVVELINMYSAQNDRVKAYGYWPLIRSTKNGKEKLKEAVLHEVLHEVDSSRPPLNLMDDSVLHEVIARENTDLALGIIDHPEVTRCGMLSHKNYYGDTPLHIAARMGNSKVAKALLTKDKELARKRNRKGETPLHKAVLYGHLDVFLGIIDVAGEEVAKDRTGDGSTIVHYAIMSNHPKEALAIAREFRDLIQTRNTNGATPLQIMVAFLKKPSETGIFESLLYKHFTWGKATKASKTDEASGKKVNRHQNDGNWWPRILGWWRSCGIVKNIKDLRIRIEEKSRYEMTMKLLKFLALPPKEGGSQNDSFEFYFRGYTSINRLKGPKMPDAGDGESPILVLPAKGHTTLRDVSSNTSDPEATAGSAADGKEIPLLRRLADELVSSMMSRAGSAADGKEITLLRRLADELVSSMMSRTGSANEAGGSAAMRKLVKSASRALMEKVSGVKDRKIWEESPLITGVKLGLDDFVINILKVCPQSATYVGCDGMNLLQAAVKYDRRQVVKAITDDDRMPSWLFTQLESDTKNSLLHIAATDKIQKKADPLRLQDELEGFEKLEKIVPQELLNYRNEAEKTAREVFDEKHEETLKVCRTELAEIGKACSPLVAAVVFTSSFYIPTENNRDSNRLAFKIFSHVYVLAFSCAATSLVMFLLLVVTPFKQRDFRRVVPWHYLMACFLLAMSLAAFIVAFACNMYLQIYGGQRKSHADLATLLLELLLVPFLCALALFLTGASWRFGSVIGRLTK